MTELAGGQVRGRRLGGLHQAEQAYDRAFNPEGVQRQLLAILAESSRVELLNRLTVPTLVVHGEDVVPEVHATLRNAIGDRTPGLARNPDGSLDIWIGPRAPAGATLTVTGDATFHLTGNNSGYAGTTTVRVVPLLPTLPVRVSVRCGVPLELGPNGVMP